jgi:glutathione S-transferase
MLTLYFSPGACSLASHIGLEETGAPYEAKPILLAKGQQRTEEYQKINPRGKVPALDVDGKVLVENTAILTYLCETVSGKEADAGRPRGGGARHRDHVLVLQHRASLIPTR